MKNLSLIAIGWHQHFEDFVRLDEPTKGFDPLVCFRNPMVITTEVDSPVPNGA
ncbi:hypothetical protein P4V72_32180 [Bacillus thuringiensis]|uniref:hypothetical protein n=1 Tax=Bacillus thuringiensis TaxID=1428 RepID=UPI0013564192|nr:hypothetical protein [Bacillus thuringiensis]MEC3575761.1 hypothetical protein [Bacillus thuringiensis]MED2145731.1 hypothetical protein [Bacillus thuringiensis]MED2522442.1 hypothetical protein [Bacillus thuringiensis]